MGEVIDLIRRQLENLKDFQISNTTARNEGSIADTIKTIRDNYVNFHFRQQEREIVNAHLLSDEHGILGFLKSILLLKEFNTIKKESFKLLNDIIEQSKSLIQECGSNILAVCILYIKRNVAAELKKASLVTISMVLETCHGYHGEKRINIKTLIEDLFFQLSLGSKLTPTVKEEILCVIGVVSHYFPLEFNPYQERVLSMYLQELKLQMSAKAKAFNFNTVSGCLLGLKEYLYNFSVLYSEEPDKSYLIFDVSRKMLSKNVKLSVTKAGLHLLGTHAPQFALFIFENCIDLYSDLMDWVDVTHREMQKLGRDAVVSMLKVVAEMVSSQYTEDEKYCNKVFKYFIEQFRDIFLTSTNSKELHIAVMGYGLFAGPCKLCLSGNEVKTMLQNVIQKCEHEFLSENVVDDKILDLSCYIESLSSIVHVTEYVPENTIFSLEKIAIFQIDKFPQVPSACNFIVPKAIIRLLLSIQQKRELFIGFLAQIVYQGIVKTCSHPVVVEAEALKDKTSTNGENYNPYESKSSMKIVTYKDYLYLWRNMLNVIKLKELNSLGVPLEHRHHLMECIYDELIRSSLSLISKLDLSLHHHKGKGIEDTGDETINVSSDPMHGIFPNNMVDYYIFINLVDFLRDLLKDTCTELFSKWVFVFGKEIIFFAAKHPYHSGFYKLLSLTLSICSDIQFFKDISNSLTESSFINKNISKNNEEKSFQLFAKCVREVAVRQQQFKDDLLASCLQVLLVLPIEIVLHEINLLVPALENALKLGMSYLPLASAAVLALEQWSELVPLEIMKPHFPRVLPYLNNYLLASTLRDESLLTVKEKKRNINKAHKMSTKLVKKSNQMDNVIEDPALLKIQLQIVKFLGRLGENNIALLEKAYQQLDDVAIAWDTLYQNHLKYSVPFVDMKPDIYLDDFLPRVLEIATKSSVRQAKVAASEALHSLVLYMIGRGSVLPEKLQEKYSMEALYKKLFPGLLDLACDVEQVTNQLFRPLVFQIIHWFSYSKVAKSLETSVILLCLWDGVTNQQNAALRDFSASCLKEFFLWSIRHSKGEQKVTENLLNKLHSFSLHPNSFKRMGAALTFNSIYSNFREHENLVKKYSIQLLVQFVESLAIAHTDEISLGTQKQCLDALNHIERIIVAKHKWFLKGERTRKKPECLEEADLQSAVVWLLRQVGCIQTECRHKCMQLVVKLAPLTLDFKSATSLLLNYNRNGKNIFEDVFENVLKNFAQSELNDHMSFKSIVFWLEALQTSMECYQWAFSKQLLLQNELHGIKYASLISTVKIYKAIEYFIENVVKESLASLGGSADRLQADIFTAEEMLRFNKIKCTVLVRLFNFIVSVFDSDAKWFHEQFFKVLWNSSLFEIIMLSTVDPTYIGFDTTDPEVSTNLPLEVSSVLKKSLKKSDFKEFCMEYLRHKEEYNLLKLIPISLQDSKTYHLQVMSGYELLLMNGLECIFSESTQTQIISSFLDTIWNDSVSTDGLIALTPSAFKLAEKMLTVAYSLGLKVATITLRLLKPPVSSEANSYKEQGLLIFNFFSESICTFASKTPSVFVQSVTSTLNTSTFSEISVLLKFVDSVSCTKTLRRKFGEDVIEAFLSCWDDICMWSQRHPDKDSSYLVLSIVTKLLLIDSEVAVNQNGKYSKSLFSTYISFLERTDTTMNFVVTALEILHFFLKDVGEITTLRVCLEKKMAARFPLQSTELLVGSSAYHTYVSAIKKVSLIIVGFNFGLWTGNWDAEMKIQAYEVSFAKAKLALSSSEMLSKKNLTILFVLMMFSLELTGCDFLFKILSLFFCKENHVLEENFKRSIIQMIKGQDQSRHQKFADIIFNLLLSSSPPLSCYVSLVLVDRVLLFTLQNIAVSPFINFFSSHIKEVMSHLKESISVVTAMQEVFLVKKIGNFKLIELLYQSLSKDLLHSKDALIVEKYLGQKPDQGNELSAEIIKLSLEFKRTSYEMENKEFLRKLNCARYSALIAVVSCTQSEVKFYNGFLFKENPIKNERIWERIIDVDVKMKFEMEVEPSSSRKNKFISIRRNLRHENHEDDKEEQTDMSSSLQLLGSENLGLSSLAEDVSKFVFSTTEPVFSNKDETSRGNTAGVKFTNSFRGHSRGEYIELEDDELNRHECMLSLCCLLRHMKKEGLIPEEPEAGPPAWLSCIIQTLEDGRTNENIKLFLGRLIINNAKIFEPFAKFLIEPLLDMIILGTAGFTLNYYILDIIITLLSWATTAIPQGNGISKASEVLKFVIMHCEHSRRDIFRNNLEVIKTVLECWKCSLEIPYNVIYEKMNDTNIESKKNVFGIQLLGVVLSCGYPPFNVNEEAAGNGYLAILLKNVTFKYKEVYGSAAEVIALALRNHLGNEEEVQTNAFFTKVVQQLENLKNKEDDKFLYCLNKIHVGCPSIADKFIPRLLYLYPNVYSSFKNYILEILYSRVNNMVNAYQEMKYIGLFEDLERKTEVTQLLSLQILEKLMPSLSCDDILYFLPGIVDIHNQPSSSCRLALYRILFVLFEKYSHNAGAKEKEITRYSQETLLIGLADTDPSIRLTIDNFWSDEKRLPVGTKERLIALMKNMFSPVTEESFLQYSTFLLLERTSHSPDYKRAIFEHPLSQCNFQAYKIQTSWRKRHVAMSPLFTESLSSSTLMSLDASSSTFGQELKLRATQRNQFSETMDIDENLRKQDTYNWLTETTLDTFAMQDSSFRSGSGSYMSTFSKSSLLVAPKGDIKSPSKANAAQHAKIDEKKSQKSSAWMLKRRFLKDNKQNDSDSFARQELRRQERRKEIQKDQRSQRDAQVVMYRQYRIGELPDIQISNSSIIQPIQALAMHDATIAKLLLQSLLLAVCNAVKEDFPEGLEDFHEEIGLCFEKILQNSYMYTPYVMSFCLESLNQLPSVKFDIETVFNACMGSNQQSIGILLLEEKLSAGLQREPAQKKMRTNTHVLTGESNYWMKLAELYRSIDAYDVVNGIFSLRLGHRKENRRALQYECSGQYYDACVLYNKLYLETSDEQDQAERDFWDKSVLSCLNKLCKWDDLETDTIARFTNSDPPDLQCVWEDQYMKDIYLPYLVRSKMKKLLNGKKDQSLLTFFDTAREDEEKKIYVETHFSEELALLYIIQDKFDIAKQYSSSCLNIFLKGWKNLSPLAVEMQHANLQHLLKYVEIDDFLEQMKKNKFVDATLTMDSLKVWQKRFPSEIDSVDVWDDVVANRHLFMSKIKDTYKTKKVDLSKSLQRDSDNMDDDSEGNKLDFQKLTLETSVIIKLRIAENCAAQGNFPVAVDTLKSIYKVSKALDGSMWSKFIEAYCSINNKRSDSVPDQKLDIVLQSWKQLVELGNRCGESVSQKKLLSQTFEKLAVMFMRNEINLSSISSEQKSKILAISEGKSDRMQVISDILDKSFSCLKSIIGTPELTKGGKETDANKKNIASAHMELAHFCNRYLINDTVYSYSPQNIPSYSDFPKVLIESLLDALKFGSQDALILFPRLLQLIDSYPSCLPILKEKVSKMPCWLFIGWIDQMVALLDKPEATAVHSIIESITLTYPNAIVYAFHLSYSSYDFSKCKEGPANKKFVEKIKCILEKQTLISDFVSALEHLSLSSIIFKEYVSEITGLVKRKAEAKDIKMCFKTMMESLFNISEESVNRNVPVGPLQKRFAKEIKPKVLAACGKEGSKLLLGSNSQSALMELTSLIEESSQIDKKIKNLKDASPWLSEFQQWKYSSQIEIPGQYTGKSKPLPEYHVKIAGFDEKVLVLSSLTSPRRITIRGNNEKEYKILVKSGEDLRQDARIQQLFSVMNEIYANDINCAKRHLFLQIYKVVPLSNRFGIIEWVDNTTVLMDFLKDGMTDTERSKFFQSGGNLAQMKLQQWIKLKNWKPIDFYHALYTSKTRDECVQKYEELVNLVPRNLLKKSFLKLSSSPEAFTVLRTKYGQSHAVLSLSQWILGIGDRHLGNFLLDTRSGCEVGIDFGHAFGNATQFLPVPELLPFRLTPQYLQLMDPLRVKGIYESTMVHTLSALCSKQDLLLSVMDIFIKEPTLDWKVQAKKQLQALGVDPAEKKDDWFPKQRVTIARKKLQGFNPSYITRKELELGHSTKPHFKNMEAACLGDPKYNVRARIKKSGLTVEEQVDCLIDAATDPYLLCLVYYGWNPWF